MTNPQATPNDLGGRIRRILFSFVNVFALAIFGNLLLALIPTLFSGSSLTSIWARDIQPLLTYGTLLDYAKAAALFGVSAAIGVSALILIPHRVAIRLVRKELPLLPLPLLRSLVQLLVTLADLAVIGAVLYVSYWLGLFPRSVVSDLFVASIGATAIKLGVSAAILFVKGVLGGVGGYVGTRIAKSAVAAHGDSHDGAEA